MNALNEVNKLIANVTYNLHKHGQGELDEWLTAEKVAVSVRTVSLTLLFIMIKNRSCLHFRFSGVTCICICPRYVHVFVTSAVKLDV